MKQFKVDNPEFARMTRAEIFKVLVINGTPIKPEDFEPKDDDDGREIALVKLGHKDIVTTADGTIVTHVMFRVLLRAYLVMMMFQLIYL